MLLAQHVDNIYFKYRLPILLINKMSPGRGNCLRKSGYIKGISGFASIKSNEAIRLNNLNPSSSIWLSGRIKHRAVLSFQWVPPAFIWGRENPVPFITKQGFNKTTSGSISTVVMIMLMSRSVRIMHLIQRHALNSMMSIVFWQNSMHVSIFWLLSRDESKR